MQVRSDKSIRLRIILAVQQRNLTWRDWLIWRNLVKVNSKRYLPGPCDPPCPRGQVSRYLAHSNPVPSDVQLHSQATKVYHSHPSPPHYLARFQCTPNKKVISPALLQPTTYHHSPHKTSDVPCPSQTSSPSHPNPAPQTTKPQPPAKTSTYQTTNYSSDCPPA